MKSLALANIAILAYKFWKSRAKFNEIKEACKAAINANEEMLRALGIRVAPLVAKLFVTT